MEREKTIRIKDLVEYILKRWRLLLICMIIFVVLLDGYSCLKSYQSISEAKNQNENEEDFSQYEDKLSEREILEVKNAVESYQMYEQSYADYKEYNSNSIKMQLNANAVSTQRMIYQITSNQKDVVNISDAFVGLIPSDDVGNEILKETGWDIDVSYVKELISVTNTHLDTVAIGEQNVTDIVENSDAEDMSVLITVTILADNQSDCGTMKNFVEEEIGTVTSQLQEQFGQFSIKKISDTYGVEANKDLLREQQNSVNEMNNCNNSMQTLENNLSDDQKSYFSALVDQQAKVETNEGEAEVSQTEIPRMQYINIKYIVVGAVIGVILFCVYAVCRFLLDSRLLSSNYVLDNLKSEVLMVCSNDEKKNKKVNIIDKWIENLFNRKDTVHSRDKKLRILCANIQIAKDKNNLKRIHIASSLANKEVNGLILDISKYLDEKNLEFSVGESIVSNIESLENLALADGVVFIEQLNQTLVSEMNQELSLCKKYDVKNLGFVLID